MNRQLIAMLLLGSAVLLASTPARSEVDEEMMQNVRKLYPLRVRDMAFPGVMILGFVPTPGKTIPKGNWFYETHFSQASNFMASNNAENYLKTRDNNNIGIGPADIAALEALNDNCEYQQASRPFGR